MQLAKLPVRETRARLAQQRSSNTPKRHIERRFSVFGLHWHTCTPSTPCSSCSCLDAHAAMLSRSCRAVARHRVITRTTTSKTLTHVDATKGLPRMVDVSNKTTTTRKAIARCRVVFPRDAWDTLTASGFAGKKGPVLATAVVAGVQGAKRTSSLIPFCHPVALDACDVSFEEQELALEVTCAVTTTHRTGVEMEALSGASIAALAVYDMTKALSHSITIEDLRLIEKTGGKSDYKT